MSKEVLNKQQTDDKSFYLFFFPPLLQEAQRLIVGWLICSVDPNWEHPTPPQGQQWSNFLNYKLTERLWNCASALHADKTLDVVANYAEKCHFWPALTGRQWWCPCCTAVDWQICDLQPLESHQGWVEDPFSPTLLALSCYRSPGGTKQMRCCLSQPVSWGRRSKKWMDCQWASPPGVQRLNTGHKNTLLLLLYATDVLLF